MRHGLLDSRRSIVENFGTQRRVHLGAQVHIHIGVVLDIMAITSTPPFKTMTRNVSMQKQLGKSNDFLVTPPPAVGSQFMPYPSPTNKVIIPTKRWLLSTDGAGDEPSCPLR